MSVRGTKRAAATTVRPEEPSTSTKRRRTDPEDALWQLRPVSDLKMASIYNRSSSEAPAELFRKDLISAMKLPDTEPLTSSEYWIITDTWKQDWERGVQVPVNPDSLPAPKVKIIENPLPDNFQEFKLPRDKYIHLNRDIQYLPEQHYLSTVPARAEAACTYDLDGTDATWLKLLNAERARAGAPPITEDKFERVIEELEVRCWDKIQAIMKSEEGLGIEYDENVICDVCRSPDSEEGNEMVFCDSCNICVHQACYGITAIPSGQWLCRPCGRPPGEGGLPTCVLCPNLGGAMKCTPSGHKWAHVSCVLWIPEVSIGCPEKMEPITKISAIPTSRWSLVCVLCRNRKGACIQCSVKTCKTAYHVTCAFKHGLEMRAIIEDENADDGVKLRSYCQKHSVNSKKDKCAGSGSEEDEVKKKRRKEMTSEEKSQARAARMQEVESEFDKHVSPNDISSHIHDVDQDGITYVYNYWVLKRRSGRSRPLLPPKSDDSDIISHRQEQADLDKMKMFVQLRQDLERVRNLCYMVSRREKLSRSFFRIREQTFHKQVSVLASGADLPESSFSAVIDANHGPSIYDRLYSHPEAAHNTEDIDVLLSNIAGSSNDEKKKDLNGLIKSSRRSTNPYKKVYVNGSSRRSGSGFSALSSEESAPELHRQSIKHRNRPNNTSTDDDKPSTSPHKKKTILNKDKGITKKGKKRAIPSKTVLDSSSDDDIKTSLKPNKSRSRTLRRMAKEMAAGQSDTETDELIPIRSNRNTKFPLDIYSDSNESSGPSKIEDYLDKSPSDSQQPLPRTKAAMKEFVPIQKAAKEASMIKKRGRKPSSFKEKSHYYGGDPKHVKVIKGKEYPSDLIVPQRQAAKKASENMRSTAVIKAKDNQEINNDKPIDGDENKLRFKGKSKGRDSKDSKESPKETKKRHSDEISEIEKEVQETIAYVPQRQAAKKAAAHIKSGLGNKPASAENTLEDKKKESEKPETKKSPKKDDEGEGKFSAKSSSSSSSNSSSSSYTSSTSSEEEEKVETKPSMKAREIKPIVRHPSLFSPKPSSRPTVDLPFLDKVSRPLSSTSASCDSDSSKGTPLSGSRSPSPKRTRPRRRDRASFSDVSPHKAPDKKLKTSERRSDCRVSSPSAQREESIKPNDSNSSTRSRTRSITTSGNMSSKCNARQRKSSRDDYSNSFGVHKTSKESCKSSKLPSTERKTDATLNKTKLASPKPITATYNDKPSTSKIQRELSHKTDVGKAKPTSPQRNVETKQKNSSRRRESVKEIIGPPGKHYSSIIDRRTSRYEPSCSENTLNDLSPPRSSPRGKVHASIKERRDSRYGSLCTDNMHKDLSPPRNSPRERAHETITERTVNKYEPICSENTLKDLSPPRTERIHSNIKERRSSRYEQLCSDNTLKDLSPPRTPPRERTHALIKERRASRYEAMCSDNALKDLSPPGTSPRERTHASINDARISRYDSLCSDSALKDLSPPRTSPQDRMHAAIKERRTSRFESLCVDTALKDLAPLSTSPQEKARASISERRASRYEQLCSDNSLKDSSPPKSSPRERVQASIKERRTSRYESLCSENSLKDQSQPRSSPHDKAHVSIKSRRTSRYDSLCTENTLKDLSPPRTAAQEKTHTLIKERRLSRYDSLSSDSTLKDLVPPRTSPRERTHTSIKERRTSRYEPVCSDGTLKDLSPPRTTPCDKPYLFDKKPKLLPDISDTDKHWFSKAQSPRVQPPPVEKPGDNDKYMTEDKYLDSDVFEKSSTKMIAKIQATLNQNTMIKSPKTPMDARTIIMEPVDVDTPLSHHVRKRSTKELDKKFVFQDASNVQGVEISKSAKIPSSTKAFPKHNIYISPQPRDNEIYELDMYTDHVNHEPFNYPELIFREETKDDRDVQETLNLVQKLRKNLKPPPPPECNQEEDTLILSDYKNIEEINDLTKSQHNEIDSHPKHITSTASEFCPTKSSEKSIDLISNHIPHTFSEAKMDKETSKDIQHKEQMQNPVTEKWLTHPILPLHSHPDRSCTEVKYASDVSYHGVTMKDRAALQSDMQSTSEFDRDTISKQSDDSQSLSVVDHSMHSIDHESISQENQTNDNNNSMVLSDCATISSPVDSRDKWGESKIITHRRSSASSTNSNGSNCSQKTDIKSNITMNSCDSHAANAMPEIDTYPPLSRYAVDLAQYNPYSGEPTSFMTAIGAVPLFSGPCGSSQLPLSSGGSLYPPIPFSGTPLLQALPKSSFSTLCAAAFTTSTQNLALTAAMIAPPTPKPNDSSLDDIDVGSETHPPPSPSISIGSYNDINTSRLITTKMSNESNDSLTIMSLPESKSPTKVKTPSKFIGHQLKSPGKSPCLSPKSESSKSSTSKRSSSKSRRSQRGRGRSKSRAQGFPGGVDFAGNSIQSKLVGTVYDFAEEMANDSVDLKALRERRKSLDGHDRKSENSYKESSPSPHVSSPNTQTNKRIPLSESIEKKLTSPVREHRERSSVSPSTKPDASDQSQSTPAVVQTVLPGPVDMRTYQPFENVPASGGDPYHSHLLAFASGTADQHLPDIDEEVEKQFHSALMASKPVETPKTQTVTILGTPIVQKSAPEVTLPKVSLSDSRNQLKVKIKGPFLDANYSSSVQPPPPQPPPPVLEPPPTIIGTPSVVGTSNMMSGTTNLRRMRKKELLRQYWTQDMNMDDPSNSSAFVPTPAVPPPLARTVITIPKAVASMTSIPTREDYRGLSEPSVIEKKKRKTSSGLSRELRHLEVSMNDADNADDTKLSTYASTSTQSHSQKRRGRVSTKTSNTPTITSPVTPKLKIKIGGSSYVQPVATEEPMSDYFRPPKKRLTSIPKPSFEDLRRESMKYRKQVMADFEEGDKVKKHKPKGEKRKRKKDKKSEKLQVVNSDSDSATKLIIKIKRRKNEGSIGVNKDKSDVPAEDPFEYDPTLTDPLAFDPPPSYSEASSVMRKIRTAKVTPIRLKLSRSAEGSGYVMKDSENKGAEQRPEASISLPVTKHCEVR